jgi:hypothetical protein
MGQSHSRSGRQRRCQIARPHVAGYDPDARSLAPGKTGNLPAPLQESVRQTRFSKGTLGLWTSDHFVIYYRDGQVPQPGIIILGQVAGDVSMFDQPGSVTVRIERAQ